MSIAELHRTTSFDDLAIWLMENPEALWNNAFPNKPMPEEFCFEDLTFNYNYSNSSATFSGEPIRGFDGVISFSCTHCIDKNDVAKMFKGTGIFINAKTSYSIQTERGHRAARDAGIATHSMRFTMMGDEWVNLAVFEVLSA